MRMADPLLGFLKMLPDRPVGSLGLSREFPLAIRGTHILKGVPDDWHVFCALP